MGVIKYSTGTSSNTIKLGNFLIGKEDVPYGPTEVTGFWSMIPVPASGYVFYIDRASGGPSIYAPQNDEELILFTNRVSGQSFTTASECFSWLSSQSNLVSFDKEVPQVVTSGLVLSLDAGFLNSYPKTGMTWSDISGVGNNAILTNGPQFDSDGKGSISLDGTNDYIDFPSLTTSSLGLNTSNGATLCCWINLKLLSRWTGVFAFWATNNVCDFGWDIYPQNIVRTWKNDNYVGGGPSLTSYSDAWTYFVLVSNSTNLLFYANGKLIESRSVSGNLNTTSNSKLTLGDHWDDPAQMKASLVQIYNRALSSSEVLQNYKATYARYFGDNIITEGMVVHLHAGYTQSYIGSGTTWNDISGNGYDAVLYNSPDFDNSDGSFDFDGINNYAVVSASASVTNLSTYTVSAWVKITTGSSQGPTVYSEGTPASWPSNLFALYAGDTNVSGGQTLGGSRLWFGYNTGSNGHVLRGTSNMRNAGWKMVTVVQYSKSSRKLYVNDVNESTDTTLINSTSSSVTIGANLAGSYTQFFLGKISQVFTYNRALTEDEILQNYNASKSRYGL